MDKRIATIGPVAPIPSPIHLHVDLSLQPFVLAVLQQLLRCHHQPQIDLAVVFLAVFAFELGSR